MCGGACRRIVAGAFAIAVACQPACGDKQEIVKVGVIVPLAGEGAEIGNQYVHGMTLAVEELNAAGGGIVYELVADDGADAARAGASFTKQLTRDKISAVVTATDEAAIAAGPKAERDFIPLFANCDHPFVITMLRDVFRNSPAAMPLANRTFAFMAGALKAKSAAILYSDDPPGKLIAQAMKNDVPSHGLVLASSEPFDASGADPRSPAEAVLSAKPEAIFVYGRGASAVRVVAALRKLGYRGPVCGPRDFASPSLIAAATDALEGCYVAVPAIELAGALPLAERYRRRFNAEPTPNVIVAYDAMMIIAKADRARRYGEGSLANALKTLGDYNGLAGPYEYKEREWLPPIRMARIQQGAAVVIR